MRTTLNIESIQQINLFSKVTGVRAKNCFNYSNSIFFVVEPFLVNRAIGINGENVKRLSLMLKKKVRIISPPESLENFIQNIVYPVKFKKLSEENGLLTITAGQQSKAALIGRDHARVNELTDIVKQYFEIREIKIV